MKRKRTAQSGLFGLRPLLALFFCAVAICSMILTGTVLGFWRSDVPPKASQRTLTFAERVAYQRAIEEVSWRHRIWPKERPDPKPPLDAVMSQAQLEKKVAYYLHNSQAPENYWQCPITAEQLQAEMDRMANHTRQPEVLQELFQALGNDPFVIAECLARPVLVERSMTDFYVHDEELLKSARARADDHMPKRMAASSTNYTLPAISDAPNGCIDDTWTPTDLANVPSARTQSTSVWTGSEMIIWGGSFADSQNVNFLNTGGRYDPATDSWAATSTTNAPIGRVNQTAVWTGSEMVIWGGFYFDQAIQGHWLNTGGRYNPITDEWTATSTTNAPAERRFHTAVWTGSEMIVWGGSNATGPPALDTGGRYNPGTDSWVTVSTTNAPLAREFHTAAWTGNEMIVWGGLHFPTYLNTGGRYNPSADVWTPVSTTNGPSAREFHTAVWSGSEMIVWNGEYGWAPLNDGGKYNPNTDTWATISSTPDGRYLHTAVWTGREMIVWGGAGDNTVLNTGGRYNPETDSWTSTSTTAAPAARSEHTAVWTGNKMIVWGGIGEDISYLNSGGRYCAQSGPTPTPTTTATPSATQTPRVAPTPRSRPTPAARP